MANFRWILPIIVALVIFPARANSQASYADNSGQLHFSNLDSWYTRPVKESFVIGGERINLFQIGVENSTTLKTEINGSSPWGTSNLHARIGVDIANNCVFPEKRNGGYCCRMETKIRGIHLIGIKFDVLVTGAIFLGEFNEPVRSIKTPIKNMNHGIAFSKRPREVRFDYKCSPGQTRIDTDKSGRAVPGVDKGEFCMILQKRWEGPDGKVFAIRIGGVRAFFGDTNKQWINGASFPVKYGDIQNEPSYDPQTMGLIPSVGPMYVKNSKGVMVGLTEVNWGKGDETPTHLVMYFNSSYQGIDFIGSTDSKFWVDNISLVY